MSASDGRPDPVLGRARGPILYPVLCCLACVVSTSTFYISTYCPPEGFLLLPLVLACFSFQRCWHTGAPEVERVFLFLPNCLQNVNQLVLPCLPSTPPVITASSRAVLPYCIPGAGASQSVRAESF